VNHLFGDRTWRQAPALFLVIVFVCVVLSLPATTLLAIFVLWTARLVGAAVAILLLAGWTTVSLLAHTSALAVFYNGFAIGVAWPLAFGRAAVGIDAHDLAILLRAV
jgi:hypothetical protein